MPSDDAVIHTLLERISSKVAEDIRGSVNAVVEQEVTANLSRLLMEGEFYRRLNNEMRTGLRDIYSEIADARKEQTGVDPATAEEAGDQVREDFREASGQLDEVLKATETATVEIMEIVERHMDNSPEVSSQLEALKADPNNAEALENLVQSQQQLDEDLMKIMTALSFQDLTGQRIARIVTALQRVEELTFNLFMSTSLKLKAKKEDPNKGLEELDRETQETVSSLKGPQADINQSDIDDLLAQMGME